MSLIPWRRPGNLTSFRSEIDDLFGRFFGDRGQTMTTHLPEAFRGARMPPMNLCEKESEVLVSLELPGLDEKDIHISLTGNQLVVTGERKWESKKEKETEFSQVESEFGSFYRSISLPLGLRNNPEDITATYKAGMLEIKIPRVEPAPSTRIEINKG